MRFAGAAHVVTLDLVNQRLVPSSMEPRCALSSYDAATGRITLRLSSQMPSGARDTLCEVLICRPRKFVWWWAMSAAASG